MEDIDPKAAGVLFALLAAYAFWFDGTWSDLRDKIERLFKRHSKTDSSSGKRSGSSSPGPHQ